jgi:hypothetical protein
LKVTLHPHARERLTERGTTESEVIATVTGGEQFPAKFGRTGFRRNLNFQKQWRGRFYATKQVTVFAVREEDGWLVITVIVRYF